MLSVGRVLFFLEGLLQYWQKIWLSQIFFGDFLCQNPFSTFLRDKSKKLKIKKTFLRLP